MDNEQGKQLLVRLTSVLHGYHQLAQSIYQDRRWRPANGSQVERELEEAGHRVEFLRYSYSVAAAYVTASQDYMVSLAKQLTEPVPLYGPVAVGRASLENSARGWWMLDPSITFEDRIRRGFVERLYSLYEAAEVERALGVTTPKILPRAESVAASAREQGFEPIYRGRRWRLREPVRSSATSLLEEMGGRLGKVVYKYASGAVHGTTYALLQDLELEQRQVMDREEYFLTSPRGLERIITTVGLAATCYVDAFDRQINLYGWSRDEWARWNIYAMTVLKAAQKAAV